MMTNYKGFGKLEKPCSLSRGDHNRKIRSRKQKTDIGKYSFGNRTIHLWNQLPEDVLGLSPVNQVILGKGLGK
jgi:hypothetical protein